MTSSFWQDISDPIRAEHDDVVIGAGIVGSYAATVLHGRGRDVALVDGRFPAAGASGRNGGFVLTSQRETYPALIEQIGRPAARDLIDMVRDNVGRMRALVREYNVPYEEGAVHLAETAPEARELEEWARSFEADGIPVNFEAGDPIGAGFAAALQVEDDFMIQPARLTEAIAAASGATLYDHNEVYSIKSEGDHLMVLGRRVQIRCRRVYVATNGYTGNLHPYFHRVVRPVRGQVLITTPVERVIRIPALTEYHYFRQFADGSILVGGSRLFFEKQEDTAEDAVTPDVLASIERYFRQWFPDIDFEIERTWAGIHGFSPDRRAAVGLIPDEPRIAFALGFTGYGNSIGLVSAERMVELALEGRDPGPLSAARFD